MAQRTHSAETRAKISAAKKGKPNPHVGRKKSEDEKRRIAEALKGRTKSAETREKLRQANLGKVSPLRGVVRPTEVRAKISAAKLGHEVSPETRERISAGLRARDDGAGFLVDQHGYIILTKEHGHPLARGGTLAEHRKILYDAIGAGPHPCHWCGVMLEWTRDHHGICPDHLDWDVSNNNRENLVVSCWPCNSGRKRGVDRKALGAAGYVREDGTLHEDPISRNIY